MALVALSFSGVAFAGTKVVRTTKTPKAGSTCVAAEKACVSGIAAGCSTQACKDEKLDSCTTEYNKCVDANPAVADKPAATPPPVANKKAVRKTEEDCQKENENCRKVLCATSPQGGDRFACELNCDLGLAKCRKDNGTDSTK